MATIKIYELDYEGFINELEDSEIGRVQGGGDRVRQRNTSYVDVYQENDNDSHDDDVDQENYSDVYVTQRNRNRD